MTPYKDLFERSTAGLYVADDRGRVLDCNDAFARLVGLSGRAELLAREGGVALPPIAETATAALVLANGTRVWLLRSESPLEGGRVAGTAIDVTHHREAARALADRARDAALHGAVGVALTGLGDRASMLRACAVAIATHLEGKGARIWLRDARGELAVAASSGPLGEEGGAPEAGERDLVARTAELAESAAEGQLLTHPIALEDRVLGVVTFVAREAPNGSSARALGAAAGAIALGVERMRAEEERRATELDYKNLVEEAPDAMVIFDTLGRFELFNPAAERISGFTASEILGKSFATAGLVAPESLPIAVDEFAKMLEGGERPPFEIEVVRKDGTRVRLESVGRIISRGGVTTAIQTTFRDLSTRSREASQRVELEEQLRQAQKMEAVGRLAGGVAHDFNNLLAVILNYGSIVLSELGDQDPIRQDVEEIQKAANRAAALTRQLLIFSRKEVAQPAVLDLNEVVADMEKLLRRTIGEDIALVTSFASQLRRVLADPGQMQQVVMNLAINARDAMPSGGRLLIETTNVDLAGDKALRLGLRPGRFARLSVQDTGVGMSDEVLSRAFEPFFTTKPKGKGTGLGLSTVYGIVTQAKGGVEILSRPGEGARFDIYLPATERPERTAEPTGVLRAVKRARKDGRAETVLVAEDEDAVRALTCRILSRHGFTILEARGPGEALLASERHEGQIDLLLTDVVMPQMSGRELAERLVRDRPKMRVLYMSGYTGDVIAQHAIEEGTIALLPKPFTEDSLILRVRQILDGEA